MARLRIAYVYDALYPHVVGGAERRYYELGRRLAPDHEVHFYSWTHWSAGDDRLIPDARYHGLGAPPRFYGGDGKRRTREALSFALRLAPQLARARFDVIDCASMPYFPTFSAQLASYLTAAPLVVTWHEYWGPYWSTYLPRLGTLAALVERVSTLAGDVHVAVSELTARRLKASGLGRVPIAVVPNGYDLDGAPAEGEKRFDAVFLGRLIPEKRVDLLLHAVRLLRTKHPHLRCAVVGDGPARPRLEALAHRLGLGDSVAFTGFVPESTAREMLSQSKVCVLPSEREGFGMVALESQAMGVPVVVARSPESAAVDLVEDGVTGLLSEMEPGGLASAIETVLTDPRLGQRLAENGRAASASYRWDHITDKMEALYRTVTRRMSHGHLVQSVPRHGAGEQASHPISAGASAGRTAPGPRL